MQYAAAKCDVLLDVLDQWREDIMERDEPHSLLPPSSILPDAAVEKLAKLALPLSRENIEQFLTPQWPLWAKYEEELTSLLLRVNVYTESSSDEALVTPESEPDARRKRARSDSTSQVMDRGEVSDCELPAEHLPKRARIAPAIVVDTPPALFVNPGVAFQVNVQPIELHAMPLTSFLHATLRAPAVNPNHAQAFLSPLPPCLPSTLPAAPAVRALSSAQSSRMAEDEHQVPLMLSAASTVQPMLPSQYVYHHYGIPPTAPPPTGPPPTAPHAYGIPPDMSFQYGVSASASPPVTPRSYSIPSSMSRTYGTSPSAPPPAMPHTYYGITPSMSHGAYGVSPSALPPAEPHTYHMLPDVSHIYGVSLSALPPAVPGAYGVPPNMSRTYGVLPSVPLPAMPHTYGVPSRMYAVSSAAPQMYSISPAAPLSAAPLSAGHPVPPPSMPHTYSIPHAMPETYGFPPHHASSHHAWYTLEPSNIDMPELVLDTSAQFHP
ncbi:hypothetical protein EWM64_g10281 [Hericium alpestre]|uniref:Uncharacterized protein n=1 Tax=Hericium alpestre TaxID=135208 RepID=A0A4Y9ZIR5_9AGAM|nr:hypothetical protein EWM64_g10281 [Hericium alpestre]